MENEKKKTVKRLSPHFQDLTKKQIITRLECVTTYLNTEKFPDVNVVYALLGIEEVNA